MSKCEEFILEIYFWLFVCLFKATIRFLACILGSKHGEIRKNKWWYAAATYVEKHELLSKTPVSLEISWQNVRQKNTLNSRLRT